MTGKRYPYEPVSFDLVKGETKTVDFRGRGVQTIATSYDVRLSDDGNTITSMTLPGTCRAGQSRLGTRERYSRRHHEQCQ